MRKHKIKWTWKLRIKRLERQQDGLETMTSINNDAINMVIDILTKKGIIDKNDENI